MGVYKVYTRTWMVVQATKPQMGEEGVVGGAARVW